MIKYFTTYYLFSFSIQMLLLAYLFLLRTEKRNHFVWRAVASVIVVGVISYFLQPWEWTGNQFVVQFVLNRYLIIFVLVILAIFACYKVNIRNAIYCGIGSYLVEHICVCCSDIYQIFCAYVFGMPRDIDLFVIEFISYLVLALMYFLFVRRVNGAGTFVSKNVSVITIVVLFVFCYMTMCGTENILAYEQDGVDWVKFEFCLYRIVSCAFAAFIQFGIKMQTKLEEENSFLQYLRESDERRYEIAKESMELINVKYHDLKHFVPLLKEQNIIGEEEAEDFKRSIESYNVCMDSGNHTLDILLSEKLLLTQKERIQFTYMCSGEALSFMEKMDIYSLVGNLLDNAYEASRKVDEESRLIDLKIYQKNTFVCINTFNTCAGQTVFEKGLPLTTKDNRDFHGFGTLSIKQVVKKYGGTADFRQEDNVFYVDIIIPIPKKIGV